jgi:hypothetical protein
MCARMSLNDSTANNNIRNVIECESSSGGNPGLNAVSSGASGDLKEDNNAVQVSHDGSLESDGVGSDCITGI